ncbi:hypothetical protein COJ48_21150 [Bacillus cereus]|nr:hypothetical protein COJ48_21150 [Bacillus cereus]PGP82578.1 hypothetical protein CN997_14285 [Bacillus cereus]
MCISMKVVPRNNDRFVLFIKGEAVIFILLFISIGVALMRGTLLQTACIEVQFIKVVILD